MDDENTLSHESYTLVGFHRLTSSGRRRLFGSAITDHGSTMVLRVRRAKHRHSLGRDWFSGEGRPLIEVELSAAQFSALLTTMNVGEGVPATLRSLDGRQIQDPPDVPLEHEQVEAQFKKGLQTWLSRLKKEREDLIQILDRSKLSKSDKDAIKAHLTRIIMEVESNIPFAAESFKEAAVKITSAAKAEVDAFVTHMTQSLGLEAFRERLLGQGPRTALPPGENRHLR